MSRKVIEKLQQEKALEKERLAQVKMDDLRALGKTKLLTLKLMFSATPSCHLEERIGLHVPPTILNGDPVALRKWRASQSLTEDHLERLDALRQSLRAQGRMAEEEATREAERLRQEEEEQNWAREAEEEKTRREAEEKARREAEEKAV